MQYGQQNEYPRDRHPSKPQSPQRTRQRMHSYHFNSPDRYQEDQQQHSYRRVPKQPHSMHHFSNGRTKKVAAMGRPMPVRLVNGHSQVLDPSLYEALNSDKKEALLALEILTQQFLDDAKLFRLAFPDVLNNYFRMLLHHVGDFYNLDHPIDTHQTGKKAITFYKKREYRTETEYPKPSFNLRDVMVEYIGQMCPNPLLNVQFRDSESRQTGGYSRQLYLPNSQMYHDYHRRQRHSEFSDPYSSFVPQPSYPVSVPLDSLEGKTPPSKPTPRILLNKDRFRNAAKLEESETTEPAQTHEERVQNYNILKDKIFRDSSTETPSEKPMEGTGSGDSRQVTPEGHRSHLLLEIQEKLKNQQHGSEQSEDLEARPRVDNPADYHRDKMHYRQKAVPNMKYNKRTSDAMVQQSIAQQQTFDTTGRNYFQQSFGPPPRVQMNGGGVSFPMPVAPQQQFMFPQQASQVRPTPSHSTAQQTVPNPTQRMGLPSHMMQHNMHLPMQTSVGFQGSIPMPMQPVPVPSHSSFVYYPPQSGHVSSGSHSSHVSSTVSSGLYNTNGSSYPAPVLSQTSVPSTQNGHGGLATSLEPPEISRRSQAKAEEPVAASKLDFSTLKIQPPEISQPRMQPQTAPIEQIQSSEISRTRAPFSTSHIVSHTNGSPSRKRKEHPTEATTDLTAPTRRRPLVFGKDRRTVGTESDDSSSRGSVEANSKVMKDLSMSKSTSSPATTKRTSTRVNGPTRPPMIVRRNPPRDIDFPSITKPAVKVDTPNESSRPPMNKTESRSDLQDELADSTAQRGKRRRRKKGKVRE